MQKKLPAVSSAFNMPIKKEGVYVFRLLCDVVFDGYVPCAIRPAIVVQVFKVEITEM